MPTDPKWTVVQHSAFAGKGDVMFEQGLETRQLTTKAEQDKVTKAGGLLFDSYVEADDFADKESYPNGYTSMIPNAPGRFSKIDIDGLAVYLPKTDEDTDQRSTIEELRADLDEFSADLPVMYVDAEGHSYKGSSIYVSEQYGEPCVVVEIGEKDS